MNNKLYAISAATVAVMIFLSFVSCGGDDSADKEDSNNNVIRTQCSSCNGTGTRQCVDCNNKGVCTWCHGDGTCDTCNGSGWIDLGGDFSIRQRCGHYKEVWTGNTWYISDKCQCYNSGKCAGCNGESGKKCSNCGGKGYTETTAGGSGSGNSTCWKCYGTGKCSDCGGTGKCSWCGGTGWSTGGYECQQCGRYSANGKCPTCWGNGSCTECGGDGKL